MINISFKAQLTTPAEPRPNWPECGKIELNSYSVRYREGQDCVLKDIDVSIKPGEKVMLASLYMSYSTCDFGTYDIQ